MTHFLSFEFTLIMVNGRRRSYRHGRIPPPAQAEESPANETWNTGSSICCYTQIWFVFGQAYDAHRRISSIPCLLPPLRSAVGWCGPAAVRPALSILAAARSESALVRGVLRQQAVGLRRAVRSRRLLAEVRLRGAL